MKDNFYLKQSTANLAQIKDNRRYFHKHAELGFHEYKTAKRVEEFLLDLGLEVQTGIAGTGVVGLLRCAADGKTAALRADMDALPMQEKNELEYTSIDAGVMHACGHDGHTAMLMETARLLVQNKTTLKGNIKFIFQPCEDMIPSGAQPMIEEGVLEDPAVDGIFTVHLMSAFPEGTLWVKPEYASISSADFSVTLLGKGGHVSAPHNVIDPIMMAGMLITDSQTLMLKTTQPGKTIVFAFGTVNGGTATNIVPDEVTVSGTIRTSSPESLDKAIEDFERIIKGISGAAGGSYKLDITMANPSIYNEPELVELLKTAGGKVLGENKVHEFTDIFPGGDDAAFFQQKVKGVYWLLGTGNKEKGFDKPHHNPYFDFDDDVLALGAAVQAQAVTDFLRS
jgi:amidohydrolase